MSSIWDHASASTRLSTLSAVCVVVIVPSIGARAGRHETRHSFTRNTTVTDSLQQVVDFRRVSPEVFDASGHALERASGRAPRAPSAALGPRVECLGDGARAAPGSPRERDRGDELIGAEGAKRTARAVRVDGRADRAGEQPRADSNCRFRLERAAS